MKRNLEFVQTLLLEKVSSYLLAQTSYFYNGAWIMWLGIRLEKLLPIPHADDANALAAADARTEITIRNLILLSSSEPHHAFGKPKPQADHGRQAGRMNRWSGRPTGQDGGGDGGGGTRIFPDPLSRTYFLLNPRTQPTYYHYIINADKRKKRAALYIDRRLRIKELQNFSLFIPQLTTMVVELSKHWRLEVKTVNHPGY